jgi:hypothetical protein
VTVWWVTDLRRLAAERAAVDEAVVEGWFRLIRWCLHDHRLAVQGVITVHGTEYPVRLVYAEQFPAVPAWVEPRDPDVHWSEHQYGPGGPLCLELRPDNWHPSATGGDVLRSAYNLLRAEDPLGSGRQERVPSAHHIGAIQGYHLGQNPVLIGRGCLSRIREGTAVGLRAIRCAFADDVWPILVFDAVDEASGAQPPGPNILEGRQEVTVVLGRGSASQDGPLSRRELGRMLGLNLQEDAGPGPLLALAVCDGDVIPYHSTDADSVFPRTLVSLPDDVGARSGHAVSMSQKRVTVIGLGSVGSKLAESLVRAGVMRLGLVDGDVMLPGNLERHTLDWRDVGFRKAHAVRRRLLNIRPGLDVWVFAENLNWQRSTRRHATLIEILVKSDLIVDATGDVPTSLFLGAIASESNVPFVSVEVLEGGIGCIIARAVPGRDGSYGQGRAGLLAFCELQAVAPPTSGTRPYEALAEEGAVVVADDAAVSVAAGHAARTAIDVLQGADDEGSPAWLLIGLRRAWIFEGNGTTVGLHVPATPDLSVQDQGPESDEERSARDLALSILVEAAGETAPPA